MLRPLIGLLTAVAAVAAALLLVAGAAFAATTYAAPNVAAAPMIDQVHLGGLNPQPGSTLAVSGSSCRSNSSVSISLDNGAYLLGNAATDGGGNYNTLGRLPEGLSGSHTLSVAGSDCSDRGAVVIEALAPGAGRAAGARGAGSTPAGTGVAVVGMSALGIVLTIGGGLMLLAGARRRPLTALHPDA